MGRRIPGRRHKGVKDPLIQRAKKNASLQDKINAPPAVVDFQEIPKSIQHLAQMSKAANSISKNAKKKKRKRRNKSCDKLINTKNLIGKELKQPGMTKPEKNIPLISQKPGESDEHFLYRLNQVCQEVIKETEFENKFGVNVSVDEQSGKMSFTKKPKEELELPPQRKKQKRKNAEEVTQTKRERRKIIEEEKKKLAKEKEIDEFEHFRDEVKFGEVVHAPPELKTLPKKGEVRDNVARPGRKQLLLKSLLVSGPNASKKTPPEKHRKEQLRLQVVEAYRSLKAQRRNR